MDQLEQAAEKFVKFFAEHGAALIVSAILIAIVFPLVRLFLRQLRVISQFFRTRTRALGAVARRTTASGPIEGEGPWLLRPFSFPNDYQRGVQASRILSLANYKGGVGKTTIAANLGACLAKKYGFKVLLVDLDFQGSLSAMAFAGKNWQPQPDEDSAATALISGDYTANDILKIAEKVEGCETLSVVKAHYDLAQADTRLLVEWLLSPKPKKPSNWSHWIGDLYYGKIYEPNDMRFNLARLLHAPSVLNSYDLIIIDCPPRVTSGSVQAFCASSHVLVPAIMDQTSSEAVVRFFQQLDSLRQDLCPHLRQIGIVPTKYNSQLASVGRAIQELEELQVNKRLDAKLVDAQCYIPHTARIINAQEQGIAYLYMGDNQGDLTIKSHFEALAQHVIQSVGVTRRT